MQDQQTNIQQYYTYRGSIHNHTIHSDGNGEVEDLIAAAARSGLDFIIITDHNMLLNQGWEGWRDGVLTLIDIEVHDVDREPQGNHCLTLRMPEDVTSYAPQPQALIDAVRDRDGIAFLAHPFDTPSTLIPQSFPWMDWDIEGYAGFEIWNFMAEFRPHASSKMKALLVGLFPRYFTTGPYPEMLAKWDEMLQLQPTAAIGGPDSHAEVFELGPLKRRFLSYDYCFQAVNTHILTPEPFNGDFEHDRKLVYDAIAAGRAWVGYDMAYPTEGFGFTAQSDGVVAQMGDSIPVGEGITLEIELPASAQFRLIRAGRGVVASGHGKRLTYKTSTPGAYRVEVWKRYWLKPRGWIFSNAIYVT